MAASDEAASLLNQLGVMQQMIEQKMQSLQKLRARTEDSTSDLLWKERNDSEVQIYSQAVHLLSFNSSITAERPLPRYSCSTSCFNQCFLSMGISLYRGHSVSLIHETLRLKECDSFSP